MAYPSRMRTLACLMLPFFLLLAGCGQQSDIPKPIVAGSATIETWPLPIENGAGQPDLTLAPDGRVLLSWINTTPGRRPALQMAEWYPDARWQGPRTIVVGNSMFVNWADTPHIAATADRALWVHWLQKSADAPYAYDIKLVRSLDHGMNWSAPRQVHGDRTTTEHGFVAFWPQSESSLGVAWLDGRNTPEAGAPSEASAADAAPHTDHTGHDGHGGGAMTLRAAVFDPQLTASAESVLDARTCDCCQTAAAPVPGGALVVYRDRDNDEIRDIYATRFDGKAWSAPKRVHADDWKMPACPVNGPSAAAQGEHAVVAWYTAANDRAMVKLAASLDGGATFATPVVVDEGAAVIGRVAVAMDAKQVLLLWLREEAGQQALWLARYSPDLRKPLQRLELAKVEGNGRSTGFPKIVVREGIAHIVWVEAQESGPMLRGLRVSTAAAGVAPKD